LGAKEHIDLFANASLFLPEDNPESIDIIRHKAEGGIPVRILMGDPDSPAMELRRREERLYEGLIGRIRMALAYYQPLAASRASASIYIKRRCITPSSVTTTRYLSTSTFTVHTAT